jgi:predicted HAD superfamily Cof-like phosphohydrolase
LEEELDEYREAVKDRDLVGVADALTDLMYVLLGTYVSHGLQDYAEALFDEVHRSNMSKFSVPGEIVQRQDGKVLKSGAFFPPDIERILNQRR